MNALLLEELKKIENECDITKYQLLKIIEAFGSDMQEKKMLKMLKTYVNSNLCVKEGEYLAVDFGGTNVRVILYKVDSDKQIIVSEKRSFSLKSEERNLTTDKYTLLDVFCLIAEEIGKMVDKRKKYFLGHTFSFSMDSYSKNQAILKDLSKGFHLREAIGSNINEVFKEALVKKGINVEPVAVINDTTATFLSGSFYHKYVDIAIIVGTGHNACYRNNLGEIINIESGYFSKCLPLSFCDLKNIEINPKLKNNMMEILTGGKYIGLSADYIVRELRELKLFSTDTEITGKILTEALTDTLTDTFEAEEKEAICYIAKILFKRSAKLIVAEIIAILNEIDSTLSRKHTIIFDGSVYEKNEYFRDCINMYIDNYYEKKSKNIKCVFVKDASNIGALLSIFSID